MPLTEEEKLIWLGLKSETSDDTYSGGGSTPTNQNGEELTTEDGDPLAGIRVHKQPGTTYDGIEVPAGTTEIFGQIVEHSSRNPIPESQVPNTEPVPDPPVTGTPGGDGTGVGDPPFEFARTVNAVSDLGWDDTGNEPIDDKMDLSNDTLIDVPPGDYLIAEGWNTQNGTAITGLTNWGLKGTGETRGDTRFHTTAGESRALFVWGDGCSNIYLANHTLDQSDSTPTSVRINFNGAGGLYCYNTQVKGYQPNAYEAGPPDPNTQNSFRAQCASPDGVGEIINHKNTVETTVRAFANGEYKNGSAIGSYRGHRGTMYLRDAHLANKGEHAYYASRCAGSVRIEGGLFENNANTNMRISGEGSYARGATVAVTRDPEYFHLPDRGTTKSARGLWWESGPFGKTGGFVEDCEFIYTSQTSGAGVVRIEGTAGEMEIRNSRIRNETSAPTVFVERVGVGPGEATPPKPWGPITLSGVTFEGASGSPPVANVGDREVRLEDPTIDMPNAAQPRGVTQ